jgi:hypothetical protein
MSLRRGHDFLINDEMHHHDRPVKVGELQVWDVVKRVADGSPVPPARLLLPGAVDQRKGAGVPLYLL